MYNRQQGLRNLDDKGCSISSQFHGRFESNDSVFHICLLYVVCILMGKRCYRQMCAAGDPLLGLVISDTGEKSLLETIMIVLVQFSIIAR